MRIVRREAARRDLVLIYRYYAREAGIGVADRFLASAEAALTGLAKSPGIGAHYMPEHPTLAELRYITISRFNKYLVFYPPIADGIEIVRVLHGARDIHGILDEEFGVTEAEVDRE